MLEMKFTAAMEKLGRSAEESLDNRAERDAQPKAHLI
jgi:hypothetical protein